ncbi:MAG: DUF2127 domain-containing protein [Acidimicrobiales bacterium]
MADPAVEVAGRRRLLDRVFDVGIVLKGLNGLVEVIGGVLLLTLSAGSLNHLAVRLTRAELSQDPDDYIAHHLLRLTTDLHHTQTFGAFYLLSHGIVKIVLVVALLRQQRWAYPWMLAFLGAFVVYQLYRMTYAPSAGLLALTVFDLFVMWLTWREYQLHRGANASSRDGAPGSEESDADCARR